MQRQHTRQVTTPQRLVVQSGEDTRLPASRAFKPAAAFHLGHYPQSWEWHEDHGFLPNLVPLSAIAGVNGNVRANGPHAKAGPVNMNGFISGFTAKGGTYIEPTDHRLSEHEHGAQFINYHTTWYDVNNGTRHYCMPWEQATVLPTGRVIWNEEIGTGMWRTFRAHLRDSGIVDPIEHVVVLAMLDALTERLDRLKARPETRQINDKMAEAERKIAGISNAWATHEAHVTEAAGGGQKLSGPKRGKNSDIEATT